MADKDAKTLPRRKFLKAAGITGAAAGAAVALVSTLFLTWSEGGSKVGSFARRADLEIVQDATFGGLAAEGGSWFGILVMLASLAVLGSVTTLLLKPGEVGRFLGADGAMFAAIVMLTAPIGFLVLRESSLTTTYSDGIGPLVAAIGGLLAVVAFAFGCASARRWFRRAHRSTSRGPRCPHSSGASATSPHGSSAASSMAAAAARKASSPSLAVSTCFRHSPSRSCGMATSLRCTASLRAPSRDDRALHSMRRMHWRELPMLRPVRSRSRLMPRRLRLVPRSGSARARGWQR